MGRAPCCDKEGLKKGPWTPEEDQKLIDYINRHGHGSWRALPKHAGLLRCGKSCRLRWTNYLRPDIKRGKFSFEEEQTIIQLHGVMGNKWSAIASNLPGRTDNEIKNYWNTHLKKRLLQMGIDPVTHRPRIDLFDFTNMNQFLGPAPLSQMMNTRLQEAVTREYYLRIAAAIIQQQQADQYNQSVSVVNAAEHVMRSNLEISLSRPDFTPNAMLSQFLAQNPENQLGSLDYNTPLPQVLDQLLSQPQIMKNKQHSSPTSTLHDLNTKLEQQDNSNLSHSSAMMNDEASLILHQKFNSNDGYNNLLNASSLSLQQQTPKSHGINSSLSLDSSAPWPEQNPFGIPKSDSDSVPTLISSTSSPNIFSDSDLVPDASSSMLNLNMSGTGSTTAVARNGSYAFPPELLWDFPENPKQNGKIPDMQNCEDTRDYWSNMLKYVAENSINNNSGLQSIGAQ